MAVALAAWSCLLALIMLSFVSISFPLKQFSHGENLGRESISRPSACSQEPWANLPFYSDRSGYSESLSYLFFIRQYSHVVFQQQKPAAASPCVYHICWMYHFSCAWLNLMLVCLLWLQNIQDILLMLIVSCDQVTDPEVKLKVIKDHGVGISGGCCLLSQPFHQSCMLKEQEQMWHKLLEHLLHWQQ